MKKTAIIIAAVTMVVTIAVVSCNSSNQSSKNGEGLTGTKEISKDSLIKRGEYLVAMIGCDDCHSPKTFGPNGPQVDMANRLSGHPANMPLGKIDAAALKSWMLFTPTLTAAVGPWGISFASNLTSDSTGIGNWTEQQFFTAIRKGKYKGLENGRPLLPPMPWPNFAKASDEDLRAIFAFLKSTPPVKNVVPPPVPPDGLSLLK